MIVVICACRQTRLRRCLKDFVNHQFNGAAHDPPAPEWARQPESDLAPALVIHWICDQSPNHTVIVAQCQRKTRIGVSHCGFDFDMLVPIEKFISMIMPVRIRHTRQPPRYRPVIEPGDKVITV